MLMETQDGREHELYSPGGVSPAGGKTTDAGRLDDRGYREAQLGAGLVEGRLHLAAFALGIGASGMTFLDSEIAGLLGEPLAGLLLTCVGVPAYRNKGGGRPGEPAPVVIPPAGLTPAPQLPRGGGRRSV